MFQSFIDWQITNMADTDDNELVACPECEGDGITTEECDCCGHEREVDCGLCATSGEVVFGKLSFLDQKRCFPKKDYYSTLGADVKVYVEWIGDPLAIVKFGFAIATDIRSFSHKFYDVVDLNTGMVVSCVKQP